MKAGGRVLAGMDGVAAILFGLSVLLVGAETTTTVCATPAAQGAINGKTVVYVTKTGTKYHQAGCSSLKKSQIPIKLEEAAARYAPCKVCKPPVLAAKAAGSSQAAQANTAKPETTPGRCQAITKKGTQCSRQAQPGSKYCWQHQPKAPGDCRPER